MNSDELIDQFLQGLELSDLSPAREQILRTLVTRLVDLVALDPDDGDLKVAATVLDELLEAANVFSPWRQHPKLTVFGSARTAPDSPLYAMAAALGAAMAQRGWITVSGAGPGIMEAAARGAGRENTLGVNIDLPFEQSANPYVDAETLKMRAFLYDGGLLPKTPVTARSLLKAAKGGGYPAFLADLRDDRGAPVPFFGHPARSNVFPALLARTTGLPLYAGAAYRLPNVRFRIRAARVPIPETGDKEADAVAGTAALQAQFEAFIRDAPEQWMWAHRKWD